MVTINAISSTDDILDIRDIIAAVERLRSSVERSTEEQERLNTFLALLDDLRGNGRDEKWEGDWYPQTLIRESYFQDYAQELAEDIGAINPSASWPLNCIDWKQATTELQNDYSSVEFDGITFWYR